MTEAERDVNQPAETGPAETETFVGDVETAGETTAAEMINGPAHQKPVGAETLVPVAEETEPKSDER